MGPGLDMYICSSDQPGAKSGFNSFMDAHRMRRTFVHIESDLNQTQTTKRLKHKLHTIELTAFAWLCCQQL